LKSGGILRIFSEDTLTHNTRVQQTATRLCIRRHDGIRPAVRSPKLWAI